ncbi:SYF2 splicing factor [Helicosporidium sp. ATCC 50920]|nr:SYF2 splicing factor [Helicosporidium sp. ATCC 50920]|eukprot:KDD76229.1 SYF2 splicing factor [Helicosporidium sp. ATCC 50920]
MDPRQRRLYELQKKMRQARKANENAVVSEKRREQTGRTAESAGDRENSKRRWFEEKQQRKEDALKKMGLTLGDAHLLETAETAEALYQKRHKKAAPKGWEAINPEALYQAYERRTEKIKPSLEEYEAQKAKDPEFYRSAASLGAGGSSAVSEIGVERMVAELMERQAKADAFSRRRRATDVQDVDYINDKNAHFNRKIERAFGQYTQEIKANLERGTALPDKR